MMIHSIRIRQEEFHRRSRRLLRSVQSNNRLLLFLDQVIGESLIAIEKVRVIRYRAHNET